MNRFLKRSHWPGQVGAYYIQFVSMEPHVISKQIEKILHSQGFANKAQLRKLLEVLANSMDSETILSPEQVIRELWPDQVRTKRAADVATEMNRLRHALDAYYEREGEADAVRIILPNRSASSADGTHEKRWILARPREIGGDSAVENQLAVSQVGLRSGVKRIAAVAALGAAAVGIVIYIAARIFGAHDEPRLGRLDGSTLTILNADGKELWKKVFPEGFSTDGYYEKGLANRIWFGDLEGKGRTDVLFLYLPATNPESHSTTLICYSDRGKEKWRWTPGKALPELEGSPLVFQTLALAVTKATGASPPRIVVSSMHRIWFPHQIAILDAQGKLLSEYWHSGHLAYMILADLDGDGKQEIVATGMSNGYHSATLVILDLDHVFGASLEPLRPEIQIHGMGTPHERLRLLFPRSDLNKVLSPYNQATEPTFDHGNLQVLVRERNLPPSWTIVYEFDRNFRLNSAFPTEDFRIAHVEFYRNGKDAHDFTPAEEAQFRKVRCLVGCSTEFLPTNFH